MKKSISRTAMIVALLASLGPFSMIANASSKAFELNQLKNSSADEKMMADKKSTLASELELLEARFLDKLIDLDIASFRFDKVLELLATGNYPLISDEDVLALKEIFEEMETQNVARIQALIGQVDVDLSGNSELDGLEQLKLALDEIRDEINQLSEDILSAYTYASIMKVVIMMADTHQDSDILRFELERLIEGIDSIR